MYFQLAAAANFLLQQPIKNAMPYSANLFS